MNDPKLTRCEVCGTPWQDHTPEFCPHRHAYRPQPGILAGMLRERALPYAREPIGDHSFAGRLAIARDLRQLADEIEAGGKSNGEAKHGD